MQARRESLQWKVLPALALAMLGAAWAASSCTQNSQKVVQHSKTDASPAMCALPERSPEVRHVTRLVEEGMQIFRHDTFGSELALVAPSPPEGSFDVDAAARGRTLFEEKARCASCHVPPEFSEPGWNLHTAEEIGSYRTAPLAGLFTHEKGGFYHDGRFATLGDVIAHYDRHFQLGLEAQEKADLVEYLESL